MKYIKKILFALLILISTTSLSTHTFAAEETPYTDFKYSLIQDATTGNYEIEIDGYTGSESSVVIPEKIDGKLVTVIGFRAFESNYKLRNLTLPSTTEYIDDYAFNECYSLNNVTLPEGLTYIGKYAFSSCRSFTQVTFPASLCKIGDSAYAECTRLSNADMSKATIATLKNTFYRNTNLSTVKFPKDVKNIDSAFDNTGLVSITMPDTITSATNAFSNCRKLSYVKIGNKITTLDNTFTHCKLLKTISIPENVTTLTGTFDNSNIEKVTFEGNTLKILDKGAFSYCQNLHSITLPTSLLYIGSYVFSYAGIKQISIPENVDYIGSAAFARSSITKIVVPKNVYYIDSGAFEECYDLESVKIENGAKPNANILKSKAPSYAKKVMANANIEGLTTISSSVFANCDKLKEIKIPNSVTSIEDNAFLSCDNLYIVNISNSVTYIADNAFKYDDIIMYGNGSKYIEEYALKHNIPYIKVQVKSIKASKHTYTIVANGSHSKTGKSGTIKLYYYPANATFKKARYSSSNPSKVKVSSDNTIYTYDNYGKATITAKALDGSGATTKFHVTIKARKPQNIKKSYTKKHSVKFTFKGAPGGAATWVYRSRFKYFGYSFVGTSIGDIKYIGKNLKSKTTYYYKFKSYYGKYSSDKTKAYKVRTK